MKVCMKPYLYEILKMINKILKQFEGFSNFDNVNWPEYDTFLDVVTEIADTHQNSKGKIETMYLQQTESIQYYWLQSLHSYFWSLSVAWKELQL